MPRFILLDNSLRGMGGHHYQYARDVLAAASKRGYKTALVTHKAFSGAQELSLDQPVLAMFRHNGYCKHALCFEGGVDGALDIDGRPIGVDPTDRAKDAALRSRRLWGGLRGIWGRWRRQQSRRRYLDDYVLALRTAFDTLGVYPGDEIFFATSSDFDLLGLVRYLKSDARSVVAHWRLQFHFNLWEGRDHESDEQAGLVRLARRQMQTALQEIPHHRVSFYSTTEQLVGQYNRVGAVEFQHLSYPSGAAFFPRGQSSRSPSSPPVVSPVASHQVGSRWQIVLAGHLRREKGKGVLRRLVERLDDRPDAQALQINIQSDRPPRWVRRRHGTGVRVERMPHPLPTEAYAALVRNSDLGLFLYDSRRYFARCSGILVEMLSSGVPVIVPAGCWLSAQINGTNQAWLAQVAQRHADAETIYDASAGESIETGLPPGVGQVLLELEMAASLSPSASASIQVQTLQSSSRVNVRNVSVIDVEANHGKVHAARLLVDRAAGSDRIGWSFSSPFGGPIPRIASAKFQLLPERDGGGEPHGSLGLTVAGVEQVPAALAEILRHHDHYRQQAVAFSAAWREDHAAERVVERLTANEPGRDGRLRAA